MDTLQDIILEAEVPKYEGQPFSLALIGTGQRGCFIISTLLKYCQKNIKEIFLFDEVTEAVNWAMNEYFPKFKFSTKFIAAKSYEEILKNQEIKWLCIASMNSLHCDHAIQALKAQKHVFCEKPLAITVEECVKIRQAAREANMLFITGFVLRYSPFYQKIKELVTNGTVGKIISLEADENLNPDHGGYIFRNWRRDRNKSGPHIAEKCCHDIDIINWLVDSKAKSVAAFGGNNIFIPQNVEVEQKLQKEHEKSCKETQQKEYKLYFGWEAQEKVDPFLSEKTVEDNIVAIIQYKNDVNCTFHSNCCVGLPSRKILICGLEGTIKGDLKTAKITVKRVGRYAQKQKFDYSKNSNLHGGGDDYLILDWFQMMVDSFTKQTKEIEIKTTVDHCFISTVTCLAIDQARVTNKVVNLQQIWADLGIEY